MKATPARFSSQLASSKTLFWFCLSLIFAGVFSWMSLQQAFSSPYGIYEDARQQIFWMLKFRDPSLFSNDWIADYFQSVTPLGCATLYQMLAAVGFDPLLANKLLPIPLVFITTAYCFSTCLQILPIPIAGFIASLLLNQNLILSDDLYSATPQSFVYPLFLAFLYYSLRQSLFTCSFCVILLGLFYPQAMLIAACVLLIRLVSWQQGRLQICRRRLSYFVSGVGLLAAVLIMLLYSIKSHAEFGAVIQVAQAKLMPEFWRQGRTSFFSNNLVDYWILSQHSGLLPQMNRLLKPPLLLIGLFLPTLLTNVLRFPLAQKVNANVAVLTHTLLGSIGLFFVAHSVLFQLSHPSDYTQHTVRIVLALAAGITLAIGLESLVRWASKRRYLLRKLLVSCALLVFSSILITYPATIHWKDQSPIMEWLVPTQLLPGYRIAAASNLYQFFAKQPKDSLIASLAAEANNLPSFSRRSVLVAKDYGIPYHVSYYRQFRERMNALIRAQYSSDLDKVRQFIYQYGIDFWLLDRTAFTADYLLSNAWIQQYQPAATEVLTAFSQEVPPIVQQSINHCTVFSTETMLVLQASCIAAGQNLVEPDHPPETGNREFSTLPYGTMRDSHQNFPV